MSMSMTRQGQTNGPCCDIQGCPSAQKVAALEAETGTLRRQLQIVTAELSLVLEHLKKKNSGVPVVNTASMYYKAVHEESLEMDDIKSSLDVGVSSGTGDRDVMEESVELFTIEFLDQPRDEGNGSVPVVQLATGNSNENGNFGKNPFWGWGPERELTQITSVELGTAQADADADAHETLENWAMDDQTETQNSSPEGRHDSEGAEFQPTSVSLKGPENVKQKAKASLPIDTTGATDKIKDSDSSKKYTQTERAYKCQHCGACFRESQHLKDHKRTHTGERRHKCSYCEARFSQQHHKKDHELIHTGEKPYKCRFCARTFRQSCNRATHEKRIHKSVHLSVLS